MYFEDFGGFWLVDWFGLVSCLIPIFLFWWVVFCCCWVFLANRDKKEKCVAVWVIQLRIDLLAQGVVTQNMYCFNIVVYLSR